MLAAQSYAQLLVEKYNGHSYDEMLEMYNEDELRMQAWGSGYDPYRLSVARWMILMAGEEIRSQIEYLQSYPGYLADIQTRAAYQQQVGIFSQGNGFTSKNITKTAEDFKTLEGVEVAFGNNAGIEHWLAYSFADYFFLVAIIIIVLAFLEERKKGLWHVIRSCKCGRAKLGFTRVGILCAASAICTLLIYALPFFISLSISGGWEGLGRSVQSLESFKYSTLITTISGWLLQYFLAKVVCGVLIGILLWCILGSLTNIQFSLSVLGVILVGEYLLYELIPVQSAFNLFKYFNIFSYVHTLGLYTSYLNINLFGSPVGIHLLMRRLGLFAFAILAVWAILIQSRRRPEGNRDILSKISAFCNKILDVFRTRLTLGGWEIYKALMYKFGIIILIGVIAISGDLRYNGIRMEDQDDFWYYEYIRDLEGVLDSRADDYLVRAKANASTSSDAGDLLSALDRLEITIADIRSKAAEAGYEPWLVYESIYDVYFGDSAVSVQRLNATAAILFLVFLCSAVFTYERQSGVSFTIRSLRHGRKTVFARKVLIGMSFAVFVWAAVYMRELWSFLDSSKMKSLGAPVQNVAALAQFPLKMTIMQYLIILYTVRLLMLICVAFVVLLISSYAKNILIAYLLGAGILVVPAALVVLGLDAMKYLSLIAPVSSAELMWNMGSGSLLPIIPWTLILVLGVTALMITRKRWVK